MVREGILRAHAAGYTVLANELERRIAREKALQTRLSVESTGWPLGSILRCAGEIDLGNVEELHRALAHSIWMGLREVDVDLVEITFLDSSAIKALLHAQRELASRDGNLHVLGGALTARLLRLLGLDGVLALTEIPSSERVPAEGLAPAWS